MAMNKPMLDILKYERPKIDFSPQIPPLKRISEKSSVDVRYCLVSPFAYAHIYWDPKINELRYEVEEPKLTKEETEFKEQLIAAIRDLINFEIVIENSLENILEYIDQRLKVLAIELGMTLSYESYKKIYYYLCRDFIGMNEIEPLLKDYFVEDIECNGVDTPIYIVHRYYRNIKTNIKIKARFLYCKVFTI